MSQNAMMNVFSGIQRLNSVQEEVMKKCESVVEDLFAEAVDGEHKVSRLRDEYFPNLIDIHRGIIPLDLGTPNYTVSNTAARALRGTFKAVKKSTSNVEPDRKVRIVFSTYIDIDTSAAEVRSVFFNPAYFETSQKARRTMVHEYERGKDVLIYLTERRHPGKTGKGFKIHEFFSRYIWRKDEDSGDYIVAFDSVEESTVPFIFEKSSMAKNRVLKVRSTGSIRISAIDQNSCRVALTSSLNSVYSSKGLSSVTEDNASLSDRTLSEMRSVLKMLLRLRDDFDRSVDKNDVALQKFMETWLSSPPSLREFEAITLRDNGLKYRALEEDLLHRLAYTSELKHFEKERLEKKIKYNNGTLKYTTRRAEDYLQYTSDVKDFFIVMNVLPGGAHSGDSLATSDGTTHTMTPVKTKISYRDANPQLKKKIEMEYQNLQASRRLENEFSSEAWVRTKGLSATTNIDQFERSQNKEGSFQQDYRWKKVVTTIPASARKVFSYIWNYDNQERMHIHEIECSGSSTSHPLAMNKFLPRVCSSLENPTTGAPTHSQVILEGLCYPGHANRKRESYRMWDKIIDEDLYPTYVIVCEPLGAACKHAEFPKEWLDQVDGIRQDACIDQGNKLVLAEIKEVVLVKEISLDVSEVTIISHHEFGGKMVLSPWVKDEVSRESLDLVEDLQRKFQRNWTFIDSEIRSHFVERLGGGASHTTEELIGETLDVARSCFCDIDFESGDKNYEDDVCFSTMFKKFQVFFDMKKDHWVPVVSPYPSVSMTIVLGPERTLSRGVTLLDASPSEVVAHFFSNTSNTHLNDFFDAGHIARVPGNRIAFNDKVIGSIYKPSVENFGFGMNVNGKPREEVIRMVVGGPSENKLAIWMESVDDDIEYGAGVNTSGLNRAHFTGLLIAENYVHAGESAAGSKVAFICVVKRRFATLARSYEEMTLPLAILETARKELDKSDVIDDENISACADDIAEYLENPPIVGASEHQFVEAIKVEFANHNDDANYHEFLNSNSRSRTYFVHIKRKTCRLDTSARRVSTRRSSLFGQSVERVYKTHTIFDVGLEEAVATFLTCDSRSDLSHSFGPDKSTVDILELNLFKVNQLCQFRDLKLRVKGIFGTKFYRIVEKVVWVRVSDDTLVVVHGVAEEKWWNDNQKEQFDNTETEDHDPDDSDRGRYGRWMKYVNNRCTSDGGGGGGLLSTDMNLKVKEMVVFRSLVPIGEVAQTSATSMLTLSPKSDVASFLRGDVEEQLCLNRLERFRWLRSRLDKSPEIDLSSRSEFKGKLAEHTREESKHVYTDAENLMLSQAVYLLDHFEHSRRRDLDGFEHTSVEHEIAVIKSDNKNEGEREKQVAQELKDSPEPHVSGRLSSSRANRSSGSKVFHHKLAQTGALFKLMASNTDIGVLLKDVRSSESLKTTLKSGRVWARTRFIVNAEIEDIAGYFWSFRSRCRLHDTDVERKTLTVNSNYSIVGEMVNKVSINDQAVKTVFTMIWYKIDAHNMIVCSFPKDVASGLSYAYDDPGVKLVKKTWVMSVKSLGDGSKCRVAYLCGQEGLFHISKAASTVLGADVRDALNCRKYFLGLKDLRDCDRVVGHGIGEEFCVMSKTELENGGVVDFAARVKEVVGGHNGLKHLVVTYPWFSSMIAAMLENKLQPITVVSVSPHDLSKSQARGLGNSFAFSLVTCLLPQSAVDEWIMRSRALQEFDMEFEWFRPMLDSMAYKLLSEAVWGLQSRLFVGASICMCDIATDIYMVIHFINKDGFSSLPAWLTAGFIFASMMIQLAIVHLNNRENQWKEKGIVLLCLKPIVDAWRVVKSGGSDVGEDNVFSPVQEAVLCKCIEMLFESIPASVVQAMAYIEDDNDSDSDKVMPLVSIVISCLSTGYILTSVSYDLDIEPKMRNTYECRGFVPNGEKGRLISFVCMLTLSTCQCIQSSFGYAILFHNSVYTRLAFLFVNVILYLIVKVAYDDHHTCFRLGNKFVTGAFTFIYRVGGKVLNDFTFAPHFVDPIHLGALFIPSMVVLHISFWYLFRTSNVEAVQEGTLVYYSFWVVSIMIVACFVLFLWKGCKRSKLRYFFVPPRQKDMYSQAWLNAEDERKMTMLIATNEHLLFGIEEHIRNWVQDNWENWQEEETFHTEYIFRLPERFIPVELREETEVALFTVNTNCGPVGRAQRPTITHSNHMNTGLSSPKLGVRRSGMSGGTSLLRNVLRSHSGKSAELGRYQSLVAAVNSDGMKVAEGKMMDDWTDAVEKQRLLELNKGKGGKKGGRRNSNYSLSPVLPGRRTAPSPESKAGDRNQKKGERRRSSLADGRRQSAVQERMRQRRGIEKRHRMSGN